MSGPTKDQVLAAIDASGFITAKHPTKGEHEAVYVANEGKQAARDAVEKLFDEYPESTSSLPSEDAVAAAIHNHDFLHKWGTKACTSYCTTAYPYRARAVLALLTSKAATA